MSFWDETEEMADKHEGAGGGGLWLKLAGDGDSAVIAFRGKPYPREVVFENGRYQPFTAEHAAHGLKPKLRVAVNVAVLPSREVKVFEFSSALLKDITKVRHKYGLDGWAYEVTRHGGAKDPNTTYSVLPERQLTDEEQQIFARLKLHDLTALYAGRGTRGGGDGASGSVQRDAAPAPIDETAAQELMATLRGLPREAVERFCNRFGVQRVRQLPAHLVDQAREFVASLQPPVDTSIDPFA